MVITEKQNGLVGQNYLWQAIRNQWLWGALTFGTIFAGTTLFTFWQRPVYQAQAQLLLKPLAESTASKNLPEHNLPSGSTARQSSGSITNLQAAEVAILRSAPLAQEVIQRVNLRDRNGYPLTIEAFLQQLKVTHQRETDLFSLSYNSPNAETAMTVVDQLMQVYIRQNSQSGRAEITATRIFVEGQLAAMAARLKSLDQEIRQFKAFQASNQLRATPADSSGKENPQTRGNLQTRLKQLATAAQAELTAVQSRAFVLRQRANITSQVLQSLSATSKSPEMQSILAEYQKIAADLAILQTQYRPEHPLVVATMARQKRFAQVLHQRVNQVLASELTVVYLRSGESRQQFVESITKTEVELLTTSSQVAGIDGLLDSYQQSLQQIPSLKQSFRELEERRFAAQATYTILQRSLKNLRQEESQQRQRVIQPAHVLTEPIASRILLNLLLGALTGGLMAFAVILILETRGRSINTKRERQGSLLANHLPTIPQWQGLAQGLTVGQSPQPSLKDQPQQYPLIVRDQPRSPESEAYRALFMNLKFLNFDPPVRKIAVTSSMGTEGKSITVANLALVIAEMGQRVLLMDGDLRTPNQHSIWALPNGPGLSNVIAEGLHPRRLIHKVTPNLDILTAGLSPASPLVLLDSRRMVTLIEYLGHSYDYIIIDTPPITIADDILVMGKMVDGLLMVVCPPRVAVATVKACHQLLEDADQSLVGVVVNNPASDNPIYYNANHKEYLNGPFAAETQKVIATS
jgi:capsular exopolysaccharide synthesis family protein